MCNGGSRKRSQIRRFAMVRNRKNRDRFSITAPGADDTTAPGAVTFPALRLRTRSAAAPPQRRPAGHAPDPCRTPGPLHFPVPRRTSIPPSFPPVFWTAHILTCKHFRSVCKFPSCRVFPVRRIDCAVTIHLTAAYRGIFKSYPRFRTGLYSRSSGN